MNRAALIVLLAALTVAALFVGRGTAQPAAERQRWEYAELQRWNMSSPSKVMWLLDEGPDSLHGITSEQLGMLLVGVEKPLSQHQTINAMGARGWEMVQYRTDQASPNVLIHRWLFKRPAQ